MDRSLSRTLVNSALEVYIDNGLSVKYPVQCVDLSLEGEGNRWSHKHGNSVHVIQRKTDTSNNGSNKNTTDSEESNFALIEKTDFNFIYVECTTEGSSYFDCIFRKIARNGLFALSTADDPALYGRPPEPALRCYAGHIVRTFYAPEMGVRLVLAAMARSAARFGKSIDVLLSIVVKNSMTIVVKVKKGAESAVKCLAKIKTLAHCSVCEERVFLSHNDGYVIDNMKQCLSCSCAEESVGRVVQALGPLWAAELGSPSFLTYLLPRLTHSLQAQSLLHDIITELRCSSEASNESNGLEKQKNNEKDTICENITSENKNENTLKRKADINNCEIKSKCAKWELNDPEAAPPFYYNLHKHKPKGAQQLLKVDKIINLLHRKGYRASRTHFDRAAVKTNCTLRELTSIFPPVITDD